MAINGSDSVQAIVPCRRDCAGAGAGAGNQITNELAVAAQVQAEKSPPETAEGSTRT